MNAICNDLDKKILAAFAAENQAYLDLEELKRKARAFDIIMGASKREIEAMWDVMNATGCPVEPLIEALERRQR